MKRFALLAVAAVMSFLLVACGDNAEKKVEQTAETTVEQTDVKAADTVKADDSVKADETVKADDSVKADENKADDSANTAAPEAAVVNPDETSTVTVPAPDAEKPAE